MRSETWLPWSAVTRPGDCVVTHQLRRAVPNENGQMALEFAGGEFRLFEASTQYADLGLLRMFSRWHNLGFPQHFKRFSVTANEIHWPEAGRLSADYLYEHSVPMYPEDVDRHILRLSYQNRAPTHEDRNHHVYAVYIAPFSPKLFHVGESIGGGHGDRGGGFSMTIAELLAWQD